MKGCVVCHLVSPDSPPRLRSQQLPRHLSRAAAVHFGRQMAHGLLAMDFECSLSSGCLETSVPLLGRRLSMRRASPKPAFLRTIAGGSHSLRVLNRRAEEQLPELELWTASWRDPVYLAACEPPRPLPRRCSKVPRWEHVGKRCGGRRLFH